MRQVVHRTLAVGLGVAVSLLAPGIVMGSAGSHGTLLVVSSGTTTEPGVHRASLLDVASGTMRVVLQGKNLCCSGAWSPDGKRIALAKINAVVLLGGDGRNPRRLPLLGAPLGSTTGAGPSFAWAPNSRSLAINEADGHRLVIRGIDGHVRVIRRTGATTVMGVVTWSPDGHWISYNRENLGGANGVGCCSSSLHLIHPDGSGDHTVTVMHEATHDAPTPALWAPDGHRFAFSTEGRDVRDPTLAVVDADSGKLTALPLANAFAIAWSADGSELAVFQTGLLGQPNSLYMIDASGQSRVLATKLPPSFPGSWSSDGTRLVIAGAQTTTENGLSTIGAVDLELVDPAGGPPQVIAKLPSGSAVEVLAWRPTR